MRKTTPGIDRIILQELRGNLTDTKRNLRVHVTNCAQCHNAHDDPWAHCNYWWDYMKLIYRLRKRVANLEQAVPPGQMTLPGM
jgi:hypothetical protein